MKTFFVIILCFLCFTAGVYLPDPPQEPSEIKILRTLSISDGVLVDPSLYYTSREVVVGEYILTVEDLELITGIRLKYTGQALEFNERGWTDILAEIYFIAE